MKRPDWFGGPCGLLGVLGVRVHSTRCSVNLDGRTFPVRFGIKRMPTDPEEGVSNGREYVFRAMPY